MDWPESSPCAKYCSRNFLNSIARNCESTTRYSAHVTLWRHQRWHQTTSHQTGTIKFFGFSRGAHCLLFFIHHTVATLISSYGRRYCVAVNAHARTHLTTRTHRTNEVNDWSGFSNYKYQLKSVGWKHAFTRMRHRFWLCRAVVFAQWTDFIAKRMNQGDLWNGNIVTGIVFLIWQRFQNKAFLLSVGLFSHFGENPLIGPRDGARWWLAC